MLSSILWFVPGVVIVKPQKLRSWPWKIPGQSVLYLQGKRHDSPDTFKVLTHEIEKSICNYLDARKVFANNDDDVYLFTSNANGKFDKGLKTHLISRIIKNTL